MDKGPLYWTLQVAVNAVLPYLAGLLPFGPVRFWQAYGYYR